MHPTPKALRTPPPPGPRACPGSRAANSRAGLSGRVGKTSPAESAGRATMDGVVKTVLVDPILVGR